MFLIVVGCGRRPQTRRTQLTHLVESHTSHPLMLPYIHRVLNLPFADAHAFQGRWLVTATPDGDDDESQVSSVSSEVSLPVSASAAAASAAISRLSLNNP